MRPVDHTAGAVEHVEVHGWWPVVQSQARESVVDDGDPWWAPGSASARSHGCACSVLANAAYRRREQSAPIVDLSCPLHAMPRAG